MRRSEWASTARARQFGSDDLEVTYTQDAASRIPLGHGGVVARSWRSVMKFVFVPSVAFTLCSITSLAWASNDDCATPTVIVGTGVFPFDCSAATTGTQ